MWCHVAGWSPRGCSTTFQNNGDSSQVACSIVVLLLYGYRVWAGLVHISWSWKGHSTPSQQRHPRFESKETSSWLPCIDPIVPVKFSVKHFTKLPCLNTSKSVSCKVNIIWQIVSMSQPESIPHFEHRTEILPCVSYGVKLSEADTC